MCNQGDITAMWYGEVKAKGLVDGVVAGCFPQLYEALSPGRVIAL